MKKPKSDSGIGLRHVGEGGWFGLLAMLLTIVIIAILVIYLLGGPQAFSRKGSAGNPSSGSGSSGLLGGGYGGAIAAKQQAQGVVCRENLGQLRAAIQMAQTEGGNPPSLEALAKTNPSLQLKCPVGGEPYQYDPATGRAWCVHPGHENY